MRNELSLTTDLSAILFQEGAQHGAEQILEYVVEKYGARGGAVFRVHGLSLAPFAWHGGHAGITSLAAIDALWQRDGYRLRIEDETCEGDVYLLALRSETALIGVLALDGITSPRLDQMRTLLAGALLARDRTPASKSFDDELLKRSPDEIERARLLASLDQSDWNISAAARKLGTTRRTIYQWIAKHHIIRHHVPKTENFRSRDGKAHV